MKNLISVTRIYEGHPLLFKTTIPSQIKQKLREYGDKNSSNKIRGYLISTRSRRIIKSMKKMEKYIFLQKMYLLKDTYHIQCFVPSCIVFWNDFLHSCIEKKEPRFLTSTLSAPSQK